MKTVKYLLIFLFCINLQSVYPQLDSLRQIYTDIEQPEFRRFQALDSLYEEYRLKQPDSTLRAVRYHQQLAKEKNNREELYYSLMREAYFTPQIIELEESLNLHNEALAIAKELKMRDKEALTIANRAVIYLNLGSHLEGVRSYYDALAIFKMLKMNSQAAWLVQNIGVVNLRIGNYDIALDYFQQYEDAYDKYNLTTQNLYSSNHLYTGEAYLEKELYEDALVYLNKALEDFEQSEAKFNLQLCHKNLALAYKGLNQYEQATYHAEKNLAFSKELKWDMDVVDAKIMLAEIAIKIDTTSACNRANDILDQLPKHANNDVKHRLYSLLYNCYKPHENPYLALQMLELSNAYQDSLNLEIDRMALTQELVKQEYELGITESQLESKGEKYAITIAAILLLVVVIFHFRSKIEKDNITRDSLLNEIESLKARSHTEFIANAASFQLDMEKIQHQIDRKLNETDQNILNVLLEDPMITNKGIANKVFLSIDGVGSSLRRMYVYFDIKESKYKKITLLLEAVKLSNS